MLQRRNLLKFAVALPQNSLIFIIQPVTFLLIKQCHGLCIELAVVYGDMGINGSGHLDTDKATASRGVGEQILLIAGADESGIAA